MQLKKYRWATRVALGCIVAGIGSASLAANVPPSLAEKAGKVPAPTASRGDPASPGPVGPRGAGNDSCSSPQSISGTGTFTFNSVNATTGAEGQNFQICAGAAGGPAGISNDEWFCWTASCTGLVTISTCGQTQVDTKIALYRGCACPTDATPPICCADDDCGRQTLLRCDVQCGQQYMIQIGTHPGAAPGTGTFTIDCAGEPCGDVEGPLPECCGAKPTYRDNSYGTFTGQVMIMTAHTFLPVNLSDYAITVFDIKDHGVAPQDVHWNPANFRYNDPRWTKANLGTLFGVTLDDSGNIYAAHTTVFNGADTVGALPLSTPGSIYIIANNTGTPSVFVNLPNAGPGIGNVSWDCGNRQLFATNFEDGRIYRIDGNGVQQSAYDHATGVVTPGVAGVIPNEPAEPDGQYARLGERVWAVQHHGDKVYYSLWCRDSRNINDTTDPLPRNQIWSIQINGAGEFIAGTAVLERNMPGHGIYVYSEPVSDISFSPDTPARMLCAERNMTSDTSSYAHDSRLIEFEWTGSNWGPSPGNTNINGVPFGYPVGDYGDSTNSAGGCDYDTTPNGRIWVSGDAMHFNGPADYIYGGGGLLTSGATTSNQILFDYNSDTTNVDKTQLGDIVIPCAEAPCFGYTDVHVRCNLTNGVPNGTYTLTFTATNNSGVTANYILLPNAQTTPHVIPLLPPLANGASQTVSMTLTGVLPETTYCFDLILADAQIRECCHARICVDIPACDCIQLENLAVNCDATTGQYIFQFTFQNLRPETLEHLFIVPSGGAVVNPDYIPLPSVAPGQFFNSVPITITNVNAGEQVCIRISVHDEHLMECCSIVVCFVIPPPCATDPCPPDFNDDGVLNSQDFFDFLVAFFAQSPAADYNNSGSVNSQDYFDYLVAFFTGCEG